MKYKTVEGVTIVQGNYTVKKSLGKKIKAIIARRFWKSVFVVEVGLFFTAGFYSMGVLMH